MVGYDALRRSAAWFDLGARGEIFATGEDRARLLHNITTNHIQQLQPGQGCYAFLLNVQGRIQADLNVLVFADHIQLDTEPEAGGRVFRHIDHYVIADDVTLEDATAQFAVLAVEGPQAAQALAAAGIPAPAAPYSHLEARALVVARITATGAPGFRLFVPAAAKEETIALLEGAGIPAAGAEAARTVRLEHFKPRFGEDIPDTALPHETQQLYAVHFNKGCYLGQEIVERVRSRGMVHRLLAGLVIDGNQPPAAGAPVLAAGAEAGKITSAAFSPALDRVVALAYLRREHAQPDSTLECEGRRAEVRPPYAPAGRA
jgi:folate-binding protein YgfZ